MALEIERKFLVHGEPWVGIAEGEVYCQGYLSTHPDRSVRVRLIGSTGTLTIKGRSVSATRTEFEYEIPGADARAMLDDLCERPLIEKTRYRIDVDGTLWEVDRFTGDNAGLVVAEVELESEDQAFARPDWIGEEVTTDPRYFNANLVAAPYSTW